MSTKKTGQKTAIILLHGIGDQQRCSTISDFLGTLSRLNLALPCRQKVMREPGTSDKGFSYFTAESKLAGRPVTIVEFHWADLSRIKSGFLSILYNFFQLVVDAPDIIYACLGPDLVDPKPRDYFVLRCLRALLALALWIIYFPVMAVNIAFAVFVGGFALHVRYGIDITPGTAAEPTFAVTAIIAIVVILLLLRRRTFNEYFEALAVMTALVLYTTLCFNLYSLYGSGASFAYRQYAHVFNAGLNGLWTVVQLIGLIFLLSIPFLLWFFRQRWRAILLGYTTTFLVIRFWLLLITTIWLIFLTSAFDEQTYEALISEIGGPIRFISLLWFDIAIVGAAQIIPLAIHFQRSRASRAGTPHRQYPRLIVPSTVPILTVMLAIAGIAIISWCNCAMLWSQCPQPKCGFVYGSSEWIIANAAMLLVMGGIIIQFGHRHFELILDIVNYFRGDRGHRCINPIEAMSSVFWYEPESTVEFRPRLLGRLKALVADLNSKFGPFDRTVYVAHSLGTMIAIEVLRERHLRGEKTDRQDLITLGSPYTAVFNHFFPHMFAKADARLLPNVTTWTNIYRENDFVGTALTDGLCGVTEIKQPPLGHGGYLCCDGVVAEVVRQIARRTPLELVQTRKPSGSTISLD